MWKDQSTVYLWMIVVAGLAVFVLGVVSLADRGLDFAGALCVFLAAVFVPRAALVLLRRRSAPE